MLSEGTKYVIWFRDITRKLLPKVGGKNASLGEMLNAKIRVPPGFAITVDAYSEFLTVRGIGNRILEILSKIDPNDLDSINRASSEVRALIEDTPIPTHIENTIRRCYNELCHEVGVTELPVAVRSSATAEDLPTASFAGQQETYLWVKGEDAVVDKVVKCWSSLFTPRAISYRIKKGFSHEKVLMSVGVQKMVNAKAAGVMFTLNPVNGDVSRIVIEGSWGLGETVVSGSVTPDRFVLDKVTLEITERKISRKLIECVYDPEKGEVVHTDVPPERQNIPCLNDEEIIELAKLAKRIEGHYGSPQDIEWAIDKDIPFPENVFILQSRPETVWTPRKKEPVLGKKSAYEILLSRALTPIKI